jgi:D-alanyl-D-alanine carboxypeptidase (penicillin-binding protein 5/6)
LVTGAQAATYAPDLAGSDSVVKVIAGESLTERQALEALLIPSADNVAGILAQWDAGSVSAFVARMNAQARLLGMTRTRYTDPFGLAASTVSTARDQLPVAGTVENFNYDVGHDGIGVKTGSDSAALGCWAFAARRTIAGTERTVYGVVLGIPGRRRAWSNRPARPRSARPAQEPEQ